MVTTFILDFAPWQHKYKVHPWGSPLNQADHRTRSTYIFSPLIGKNYKVLWMKSCLKISDYYSNHIWLLLIKGSNRRDSSSGCRHICYVQPSIITPSTTPKYSVSTTLQSLNYHTYSKDVNHRSSFRMPTQMPENQGDSISNLTTILRILLLSKHSHIWIEFTIWIAVTNITHPVTSYSFDSNRISIPRSSSSNLQRCQPKISKNRP